jgi:hypothetical protein
VPEVDGTEGEGECPVDVTPPAGEIRNPKFETSGPQPPVPDCRAPILDSPEEDEAIRAAYQARLQRVLERIEQDEANTPTPSELDPAASDRSPPELGTPA